MYNKYLKTFIIAADTGSIAKTADVVYCSPTAVMKQINSLEQELGIKLFMRSNKGLRLTDAGKVIYEDAKYMIRYSEEAIERAQIIENNNYHMIRIGTSLMNPVDSIQPVLKKVREINSHYQFQIIPFDDYRDSYVNVLEKLGSQIDIIAGIYGFSNYPSLLCNTLKLWDEEICIAVPEGHRLDKKKTIKLEDLDGESIFILPIGQSPVVDEIRYELSSRYPNINLINAKTFDMMIFNQCQASNSLLITTPSWAVLHPMLIPIHVDWNYTIPFGITYPIHPNDVLKKFIDIIDKINKEK